MSQNHTILQNLPIGQKVGIAFSGGLDTSAALLWMKLKGALPYAYTANLGQPDEDDYNAIPKKAMEYGAENRPPDRLPRTTGTRRHCRHPMRRVPRFHRRHRLLQHHASGPRRDRHHARFRHERRRCEYLGRRQHLQRQRHRAFLPLRPVDQSGVKIYKPWLDQQFIDELGGRHEMSEFLIANGFNYKNVG